MLTVGALRWHFDTISSKNGRFWSKKGKCRKVASFHEKVDSSAQSQFWRRLKIMIKLLIKFAHFQDKADISESTTGAFPAHNTKDFQGHQHQQHQHQQGSQVQQGGGNISSSASPSMKQPGQQEGGGGPTGQHANVIIPRGGRRPSGKQVRQFF